MSYHLIKNISFSVNGNSLCHCTVAFISEGLFIDGFYLFIFLGIHQHALDVKVYIYGYFYKHDIKGYVIIG